MGYITLPTSRHYRLANCSLADIFAGEPLSEKVAGVDVEVRDGRIATIRQASIEIGEVPVVDCRGGMIWPTSVDLHTHLDKAHIWNRAPNPSGDFAGAVAAMKVERDRLRSQDDILRRAEFALASAYVHGTAAIRTHVDARPSVADISWGALVELRESWRGRIALQLVSAGHSDLLLGEAGQQTADLVQRHDGLLGCVLGAMPDLEERVEAIFQLAKERDLSLDLHVDENDDPASNALLAISRATIRYGYEGRVNCGHCCSLALFDDDRRRETIRAVSDANISIVSLPMCNIFLMDRKAGRTPRWRGITLLQELHAARIPVSLGSDNVRDPFYAYGDLDMVEVFREAVRLGQLDLPIGSWPAAISLTPAALVNNHDTAIVQGNPADFIVFKGRCFNEILSRPQSDRVVVRSGLQVRAQLPDYEMLDDLMDGARGQR